MRNRHKSVLGSQVKDPDVISSAGRAGLENVALICGPTGPPGNFPPELNSIAQPQVEELEKYINNDAYKELKETIDNYEGEDFDELESVLINKFPELPTDNITEFMEKLIMYQQWIGEAGIK